MIAQHIVASDRIEEILDTHTKGGNPGLAVRQAMQLARELWGDTIPTEVQSEFFKRLTHTSAGSRDSFKTVLLHMADQAILRQTPAKLQGPYPVVRSPFDAAYS